MYLNTYTITPLTPPRNSQVQSQDGQPHGKLLKGPPWSAQAKSISSTRANSPRANSPRGYPDTQTLALRESSILLVSLQRQNPF